jgi:hypothetical protein
MDRIVELVEKIETAPEVTRDDARALVSEVIAFHREGLRAMVEIAAKTSALDAMKAHPLVASLLELHDLNAPSVALVPANQLVRKKAHDGPCDLCGKARGPGHPHLIELASGAVRCSCKACALLFEDAPMPGQRYRRIPDRVRAAEGLSGDDSWWSELGVPIGVAFFVRRDEGGASARYPGPAGAIEAPVPAPTWNAIAERHPALGQLVPEVEALVVNRIDGARKHWFVGIDRCYELVGLLREHWRGFTGGDDVRREIDRFFDRLERAA